MSFEQTRRIRLVNLVTLLAGASAIVYSILLLSPFPIAAFATVSYFSVCVLAFFLNRAERFYLASHSLFIASLSYILFTAAFFGREAGAQWLYLPVVLGVVLIFDIQYIRSLIFLLAATAACLLTLEISDYNLIQSIISAEHQRYFYYGNLILTFSLSVTIALFYFVIYARQNMRNEEVLQQKLAYEKTINYFATSLYGTNTVDEILWDIAKNCIGQLGFVDCVIYSVDMENKMLIQKAAFGAKNPTSTEIQNSIQIPIGRGIVGSVAASGQAEVVSDTSLDSRYIVDDQPRLSEITVPIIFQEKVFAVIDSEHPDKNFFTDEHLRILQTIAALTANKIAKAKADEERLDTTIAKLEADKILELDKLKSKFFARISHEFRTPLTLILGPLDDMIQASKDAELTKQYKSMYTHGRKLLQLINDLLELAKLDEGILAFNPVKEDIHHFIRSAIASFQSQATHNKIKFESSIPQAPLFVAFDIAKMETILIALLNTSLKVASPSGTITISSTVTPLTFILTITNRGSQLPAEVLDTLFDRFPLDEHEHVHGFGIALALAKEFIGMHGGEMSMSNTDDRNIFQVRLPISDAAPITKNLDTEGPLYRLLTDVEHVSKKPLVLLVEDNQDLRKYLRKVLEVDFSLQEASNGAEGLAVASQNLPDLIISDVMMPIKDGFELCTDIKNAELTCHIPVLLLTARADMESRLEGLSTGADYYLSKPFEPRELLVASANLIAQRKKLRENFSKKILLEPKEWEGTSADERFLKKLMAFTSEKFAEPNFGVEDMQREMGISRMQLHRKLKALTDQSATEFIRSLRLKRAAEMLQKQHDNVSQVAYQVGFSSLSYFTKCFKEQYGVLPSEIASKVE